MACPIAAARSGVDLPQFSLEERRLPPIAVSERIEAIHRMMTRTLGRIVET